MIFRGFASDGESSSVTKAHLRNIRLGETLEVQIVSKLPQLDTTITFSDSDMEGCQHPYDDSLVIRAVVANKTVHRVLIYNGSSADIIFASTFEKMGFGREKLEPVNAHLLGYSGEKVLPLGSVQLVLTLGDPPMSGHNVDKIPHNGCPIGIQHVTGKAFYQCHKSHPFRQSYGCQILYGEWSGNGPRRPAGSQGVLLDVNETESG